MRFLSLFSGIEAFSVATHPLGWDCVAVAEIEPFPCKVLAHHYPNVPNLGDITRITREQIEALGHIDVVVFGAPCQDLSVAGKRKGMFNEDGTPTRSGLFFAAIQICEWSRARFSLYENVPGMFSSSKGRDFAAVVGEMAGCEFDTPKSRWQNSGVAVGPLGLIEWITLDAQYIRTRQFPRAVPQRRRRVFVVRDSGNWTSRPPLFLESEGLRGNPPPIRKTREDIATDATRGVAGTVGAKTGLSIGAQDAMNGHLLPVSGAARMVAFGEYCEDGVASAMKQRDYKDATDLVYTIAGNIIGRSEGNGGNGFGYSESGEGYTLTKTDVHAVCYPIDTQNCSEGHNPGGKGFGKNGDPSFTIGRAHSHAICANFQIRRITPVECERLQGFPDNHTAVPGASDTTRYRALGNSMATNVMEYIATRIEQAVALGDIF